VGLIYLVLLLAGLAALALIDRRLSLLFWKAPVRAGAVLAIGLVFFLAWDLSGIGLGIFFRGETPLMTGVILAPQLPLEEPFFLLFLCYLILLLVTGTRAILDRREATR
jgi:lycopene cyclase domain-containing protein